VRADLRQHLRWLDRHLVALDAELATRVQASPAWRRGLRRVSGGRAPVRTASYMAAVTAARHNPLIRPFYQRLRAAGKPAMVALMACMRKLLTILNAMVRYGTPWTAAKGTRLDTVAC